MELLEEGKNLQIMRGASPGFSKQLYNIANKSPEAKQRSDGLIKDDHQHKGIESYSQRLDNLLNFCETSSELSKNIEGKSELKVVDKEEKPNTNNPSNSKGDPEREHRVATEAAAAAADKLPEVGESQPEVGESQPEVTSSEQEEAEEEAESFFLLCSSIEISLEHYFNYRYV